MANIGNIIGGLGAAASGAGPVLQQQQQQAALANIIKNYMAQQQMQNGPGFSAAPPPAVPTPTGGGLNSPPGGPVPLSGGGGAVPDLTALTAALQRPGIAPTITPYTPPAAPSPVGGNPFAPVMNAAYGPGSDSNPQTPAALITLMNAMAPTLNNQNRLAEVMAVAQGRNETAMRDTDVRADTSVQNTKTRSDTTERGQDIRALSAKEKNSVVTAGQDKTLQARMAAMAARGTPEQQQAFRAAQTEFQQASMNYRNAKISPTSSLADIQDAADKAVTAQQKMEGVVKSVGGAGEAAPNAGPPPNLLKEGVQTKFSNGQTWTLQGGKPVQVQ